MKTPMSMEDVYDMLVWLDAGSLDGTEEENEFDD